MLVAIFQLMIDLDETCGGGPNELPIELMQVVQQELEGVVLYPSEQRAFRWLWLKIIWEMKRYLKNQNTASLRELMIWMKTHEIMEFNAVVIEEGDWKRYLISFSDHSWEEDQWLQIAFQNHSTQYGECREEERTQCLFLVDKEELPHCNAAFAICGCAMMRALEEPFPQEYFDALCEHEQYRATIPYLIMFLLHAPTLQVSSGGIAPSSLS